MGLEKIDKYEDSFYIAIKFGNNTERYLYPHGAKMVDEIYSTSLTACYKAIVRFISKPRSQTLILFDAKDHIKEKINKDAYEDFGLLTIHHIHSGETCPPIRTYAILKAKNCLFKEQVPTTDE